MCCLALFLFATVHAPDFARPAACRSDHLMLMATFELLPCQEPPTEYTPPQTAATLAELSVGADFSFGGGFGAASAVSRERPESPPLRHPRNT